MAGLLVFSAREPKKIVNPAGMTADGRQQSKVQVTNKRIVCSEESPLPASVYDNYAVRRFAAGGLGASTLAGEWDLVSHGFLTSFGARRFPKGERKALW